MNNVEKSALELKEKIQKIPEIREFLEIKEEYEKNEEIKILFKEITLAKQNNDEEKYLALKEMYDKNPLVQNYNYLKEEVTSILKEISDVLNS